MNKSASNRANGNRRCFLENGYDVAVNDISINSIGFDTWFWTLAIVENHVVAFCLAFRFEVCSELLLSCLICPFVSPDFRLNDVFLAVVENREVDFAASSLPFKVDMSPYYSKARK